MPATTGWVETTDGYPADGAFDSAIVGPFQRAASVQFTVSNADVVAQVAKLNKKDNSLHWDPFETSFAPGVNGYIGEVHGVRIRSKAAGVPAVVAINLYFSDDPIPFSGITPKG